MKLIFAIFFAFVAVSALPYEEFEFPLYFPIEGPVYDFTSDETSMMDLFDLDETEEEFGILPANYEETFLGALPGALYGAYQAGKYGYKIGKYGYKIGKYGLKGGRRGYRFFKKWRCKRACKKRYDEYSYYRRERCISRCRGGYDY